MLIRLPMSVGAHAEPFQRSRSPVAALLCVNPAVGRPVQLVSVPADGVPMFGVVSDGDVARTGAPLPVAVVHTGNADAPPPTNTSVVAPAARVCCAPLAVVPAAIRPYAVVPVARPVPPLVTGRVPVTPWVLFAEPLKLTALVLPRSV